MVGYALRLFGWLAGIVLLFAMIVWALSYHQWFPLESRMIALAFFPPWGFAIFVLPLVLLFLVIGDRKTGLATLVVFLLFFLLYGDIAFTRKGHMPSPNVPSDRQISVIALNLRYYSYGLERVVAAIREMDADVYLLSENVISKPNRLKLERMIHPWRFFMGRQAGTAIISRLPVIQFKEIELPTRQASLNKSNEIEEQHLNPNRSFVHAVVDVAGIPVHTISIRFLAGRPSDRRFSSALQWGFYVLGEQLKELDYFLSYLQQLEGPVVFGGDLNATPSSVIIQKLNSIAVDSYLETHFWGGLTFWTQFPPYARLDYLFCKNNVAAMESQILDVVISDHYPVYGRFQVQEE